MKKEIFVSSTFKDFQVVLVDDGTQDNSAVLAEKILQIEKIEYKIIHQNNKGLPAARNTGLKNADGEYVVFVDSDDVVEREFGAYKNVADNFPKYVITMDKIDYSREGIIHKNIIDWLLEK